MLEEENGVRILDRGGEKPLRVVRRGRAHDLEPGDVRERALGVLRVERPAGESAARRQPHDDRDRRADAEVLLRGDGDEVIPCARDEVRELHLRDGPKPHERSTGRAADDRGLRERRVDDAPRPELLLEAERHLERAPVHADVLAEDEDTRVSSHLEAQRVRDRLDVGHLGHGYLWCGVSRSSGEAKTPLSSDAGSGSGDSSARSSASFSSRLTVAVSSPSSSSVMSALACSHVR